MWQFDQPLKIITYFCSFPSKTRWIAENMWVNHNQVQTKNNIYRSSWAHTRASIVVIVHNIKDVIKMMVKWSWDFWRHLCWEMIRGYWEPELNWGRRRRRPTGKTTHPPTFASKKHILSPTQITANKWHVQCAHSWRMEPLNFGSFFVTMTKLRGSSAPNIVRIENEGFPVFWKFIVKKHEQQSDAPILLTHLCYFCRP